jgi:hypothetical protein
VIVAGLGTGTAFAQGTPEPMALFLIEEVPIEMGCGEVREEYLEFFDEEDIKLFRLFVEPGATVMVSVKDYGEAGDIWQACLT